MKSWMVLSLIAYAALMSCGQILFKLAANSGRSLGMGMSFSAYLNGYFLAALVIYFGLTIFWVWIVKFIAVSKAYPVVSASFIFTPLLANFVLGEKLPSDLFVGSSLIVFGVYLLVR